MVMVQTTTGSWISREEGMFPLHICWLPDTSYYSMSQAEEIKMGRAVEKFAQVKQSLTAQLEDELDLQVGQIVKITHIIDKDWYRYVTTLYNCFCTTMFVYRTRDGTCAEL